MTTPFANADLSAYLDGELNDTEVADLEALLQEDAELRAELATLEEATDFFRTHAPARAPDNFVANVLALVELEPVPANNVAAWWRRPMGMPIEGVAVAAAALLVLGVTLNFQGAGDLDQLEAPAAMAVADKSDSSDPAVAVQKDKSVELAQAPGVASDAAPSRAAGAAAGLDSAATGGLAKEAIKIGTDAYGEYGGDEKAAPTKPAVRSYYNYTVTTDDPAVMAGLLRAAVKHRGRVERENGQSVDGSSMDGQDNGSFFVHIPAAELATFGEELRSLGTVSQAPAPDWYASEMAKVRVDVRLIGAGGTDVESKDAYISRPKSAPAH